MLEYFKNSNSITQEQIPEIIKFIDNCLSTDNADLLSQMFEQGFDIERHLPGYPPHFFLTKIISKSSINCLAVFMEKAPPKYTSMNFTYDIVGLEMPTICYAAATSSVEVLKKLVEYGANPHALDSSSGNALLWAMSRRTRRYIPSIEYLLSQNVMPIAPKYKDLNKALDRNIFVWGLVGGEDITDMCLKYINSFEILEENAVLLKKGLVKNYFEGDEKVIKNIIGKIKNKIQVLNCKEQLESVLNKNEKETFKKQHKI